MLNPVSNPGSSSLPPEFNVENQRRLAGLLDAGDTCFRIEKPHRLRAAIKVTLGLVANVLGLALVAG